MKRMKKARQRKRREMIKLSAERKLTASEDKSFAALLIAGGYPHMEWNGAQFVPQTPAPSPKLDVNVSIMHSAHTKLGVNWKGSRKGIYQPRVVSAITDTGCQTCTAGVEFLEVIACPESYLIPTRHQIVGITDSSLGIIGAVLLRIEVGGGITRQMVHISKRVHGLYLSERSLKDLGVIPESFPLPISSASLSISAVEESCHGDCLGEENDTPCLKRTATPDRPDTIPFPPTIENRSKLRDYLLNTFASSGFNSCTYQILPEISGEPLKIEMKNNAHQAAPAYRPIPVPFHFKEQVKKSLDRLVRMGVLERVPQGNTVEYCARMVVATKTNGNPRIVVDFQDINKETRREVHHTPSPFNLVSSIPAGKLKTVVDASDAFHSLLLAVQSRELTNFITEWGMYRYCRGPQGFHGTGDAYTRRYDDITSEEQRYIRCIDDGLLYDDDIETAFWHTFDHIKRCADHGVVFNRHKFRFAEETVEFAGFELSMDGFKPAKHTVEAIMNFPEPTSITDVRSWFGLVNQVAYTFSESDLMHPFRCLLQKEQPFYWDDRLRERFEKSKKEIVRLISNGVRAYDMNKPTCLATDWSKEGLGFSLMQKHCKCSGVPDPNCGVGHWQIVFAGSKTTNAAQRRYCPIEGECLAAAYGLERCRMYTLGCPDLILAVDHKPLINILNDRHLDTIPNPRLCRLKEKTFPFRFRITHVPGGSNAMKVADALSRHPVDSEQPNSSFSAVEEAARAHVIMQAEGIESITWRRVNEAAAVDEECVGLVRLIVDGFPTDKTLLPPNLQQYWTMKDDLYVIENVPFKGHKMLIPTDLRVQVLEGLHAANQGVTGMLSNARSRFFWPGLDAAVRQIRLQCRQCNQHAPSQPVEPMVVTPPPEVPFQQTVTDLFSLEGHTFLAYADRFSGWLEVDRLPSNAFRYVRQSFLKWFSAYGVPEELASDGGPPFNSHDYKQFLKSWGVDIRLSSAYFPQSNGRAEAAVKSAKRILLGNINPVTGALDTDAAARALMTHRNTPTQESGISPAIMLFGRSLRDHLPRVNRDLRPEWNVIADSRERALAKRALKDIETGKRELKPLSIGDSVQLQNQTGNHPGKWFNTGVVAEVLPNRQYHVVVDGSRRVSLRNRRFLKKINPVSRKIFDLSPDASMPADPESSLPTSPMPSVFEPPDAPSEQQVPQQVMLQMPQQTQPAEHTYQHDDTNSPSNTERLTRRRGRPLKKRNFRGTPWQLMRPAEVVSRQQQPSEITDDGQPDQQDNMIRRSTRVQKQRQTYDASTGDTVQPCG